MVARFQIQRLLIISHQSASGLYLLPASPNDLIRLLREPERLEQPHWNKIFTAADEAEKWPGNIHYIHSPGWTANRIIAKAVEQCELLRR